MARILVLDSDSDSRRMVTRFLQLHDHQVVAFGGFEQIPPAEYVRGFSVAVINEPQGGTSLEGLVDKMTQVNRSIKVIAITDATPDLVKGSSSAYEVIFRPIELAAIETAIEKLLRVT